MKGRLGFVLAAIVLAPSYGADEQPVDFARDIQPLLQAHCISCHGPSKARGQLRLDSETLAFKGGLTGKAIVPRKSGESLLVTLLLESDADLRMPQKAAPLPAAQIDLIRRWIDQGAIWPDGPAAAEAKVASHWAYVRPLRPDPPAVAHRAWVRSPIDAFILARLEREGLEPSPEAPRETLLRRLSLDLTGLPPQPDELRDASPGWYERAVDRLLASPHYGERWARAWLDLARYADSNGYERDGLRTMWTWRDWVIRALNEDMPFTQFTVEQLAGDLLPEATTDQRIATGFHRNSMLNEEDGVDRSEIRWNTLVERVGTTAAVWLGTTLACAQCHNHKYDPFSQKDFYRLLAFFESADEPVLAVPTPEQQAKRVALEAELAAAEETFRRPTPEILEAQREWERRHRRILASWQVLEPTGLWTSHGTRLEKQPDGSILATGAVPERETYRITARTVLENISAFRLEVLADPSLPGAGPGRAHNGDFVLSEFQVVGVPLHKPAADFASKYAWIPSTLDGKPETGWAVGPQLGRNHTAFFETRGAVGNIRGTDLTFVLDHQSPHPRHLLGRFRLSALAVKNPTETIALPVPIRTVLGIPALDLTPAQEEELAAHFRTIAPTLRPLRDRMAALRKEIDRLRIPTALVMRERSGARTSTHVRLRGNFLLKGEEVSAGIPGALSTAPAGADRLALARWLTSDENPLTARVIANRAWEQIFGRGIVETGEDFGIQGSRPSHPELLDWLATEFVRQGWSLKRLHRAIVTSAVYRQSSRTTPVLQERDQQNRLLARGPSFRLDAEAIRDVALAASGLLSRKIGGPSVFPLQPEGTWKIAASKESEQWTTSPGTDRFRRGLYVFWRRSAPYPMFTTFDAPSREFCTVRRARTNTPLQALTLLNDPAFFEAARGLAGRMMTEGGAEAKSRLEYGHRLCVGRLPEPAELRILLELYDRTLTRSDGDPAAALTLVANALLNLDETVTKD
jgi:hypothetical protein